MLRFAVSLRIPPPTFSDTAITDRHSYTRVDSWLGWKSGFEQVWTQHQKSRPAGTCRRTYINICQRQCDCRTDDDKCWCQCDVITTACGFWECLTSISPGLQRVSFEEDVRPKYKATLSAQLRQLEIEQRRKGPLRSHLWCSNVLARSKDRIEKVLE